MAFDYEREKREAIDAGRRALQSLRQAKKELNSAGNWGLFDLFGGGLFSDLMKHGKMNRAQECMERAKYDLKCFNRELHDISSQIDTGFNQSDFFSFADYFFDGILADWMMQRRIDTAKQQVDDAIRKVERILHELERR